MPRKPHRVAHCEYCGRDDVGVWQTRFNSMINPKVGQTRKQIIAKLAPHGDRNGAKCRRGSGVAIPEAAIMENT